MTTRAAKRVLQAVEGFKGLDTESHPVQRDPGLLQVSEGSSHERNGIWSVRRGWTHANVAKKDAAISGLVGLELGNGDYVIVVAEGVNLRAEPTFDESGSPSSTLLYSSIATDKRPHFAVMDRKVYVTDGWKRMQVWDGVRATTQSAGIVGPGQETTSWSPTPTIATASPGITEGTHLVRYRYLDSRTGYVSEPSNAYSLSADGDESATFNVGAALSPEAAITNIAIAATTITRASGSWTTYGLAVGDYVTITNAEDAANDGTWGPITTITATVITIGSGGLTANADDDTVQVARAARGRIQPSDDAKVDRIVVEMTLAGGSEFFKATEALESDTTIAVNVSDETLAQNTLLWEGADGDLGVHNLPPIARYVLAFRGRLFTFGQVVHSEGTVSVTNGSASVAGTSTDWSDALGGGETGLQRHPRMFQVDGDTQAYEIDEATSATALSLKDTYAGSTASGASYRIWSRDNYIYVSEPGFPESWPLLNFIPGPQSGRVRACVGVLNGLLICSPTGMDYFNWNDDPVLDGVRKEASKERGAVSQRVCLNIEEKVYGLDQDGVWRFEGVSPDAISQPIESIVRRINFDVEEKFHAVWHPRLRAIRWWVALDDETDPYHYLQFHIDTGFWSTGEREVAVVAGALVPTGGVFGGVRALVGDENGHTWIDDTGDTDGADTCPKVTATGTPSTTVVSVTGATLPTSGTGLAGVVAYFERLNASRVIASNTASQITLATALSEAPASGDVVWLGRIKAKLKTKAFVLGSPFAKHKGVYLHVWFTPLDDDRQVLVRVYRDYSDEAAEWGDGEFAFRREEPPRGLTYPDPGSTDWKLDLSTSGGVARIGLGDTSVRSAEVELEFRQADTPARILAIAIEGIEQEAVE